MILVGGIVILGIFILICIGAVCSFINAGNEQKKQDFDVDKFVASVNRKR